MLGARVGTAAQTHRARHAVALLSSASLLTLPSLLPAGIPSCVRPSRCTKLRKAESMVHYWDARVPFWNGKGSHADIKGQETRAFIADLEAKARKRYDALY